MTKIYTKRGDNGLSSICDGKRLQKGDPIFEFLGTCDELSCWLGKVRVLRLRKDPKDPICDDLIEIQQNIQDLNSEIAGANLVFDPEGELIEQLEQQIDEYTAKLPRLKNFILPGGYNGAADLHMARSVCRRAERCLSHLHNPPKRIQKYVNRLSDYLFTLARYVCEKV